MDAIAERPGLEVERDAERRSTTWNGVRTEWRLWGSGSPVVLIHGSFGSWLHWIRNIPALAAHHCVLVPDLPGYGDSGDVPSGWGLAEAAGALHAGLGELVPGQRVVVIGFSMGGAVAVHLAARLGRDASRLVLVGTSRGMGFTPVQREPLVRWRGLDDAGMIAAHRRNLEIQMIADPDRIDELAISIQTVNTRRTRLRLAPETRPVVREKLSEVTCPVAGIWGTADPVVGRYGVERVKFLKDRDPNAAAVLIEGAGHWVQYEAAAEFDAALARILAS